MLASGGVGGGERGLCEGREQSWAAADRASMIARRGSQLNHRLNQSSTAVVVHGAGQSLRRAAPIPYQRHISGSIDKNPITRPPPKKKLAATRLLSSGLSLTGFYRVLPGFTGFYRVKLGCAIKLERDRWALTLTTGELDRPTKT